jgi:hypothetical protein
MLKTLSAIQLIYLRILVSKKILLKYTLIYPVMDFGKTRLWFLSKRSLNKRPFFIKQKNQSLGTI